MATQGMLREDISEERQKVAKLCWQLENMKQLAKEEDEDSEDNKDSDDTDEQEWIER